MENSEEILEELIEYDKNPTATIPQNLENYLKQIAKTGYTRFPWQRIKTLFKVKLENVIADFSVVSPVENVPAMPNVEVFKYEEMKTRIFEQLESYSGVPFTIQRICELITTPYDYYKRIDKFMRGLERVMLVVTIIDPNPLPGGGLSSLANGFSPEMSGIPTHVSLIPVMDDAGTSKGKSDGESGSSGIRRPGDNLVPPAKRIRISQEEDGGPCDSADQIPPPLQNGSPPGNECLSSGGSMVSSPDTATTGSSTSTSIPANNPTSCNGTPTLLPTTSAGPSSASPSTSGRSGAGGNGAEGSPSTSSSAVQGEEAAGGSSSTSTADSSPSESSPKPETREAVPETHEDEDSNSGGETNNEAEINTDTADGSQQEETNCAGEPSTVNTADETDSGAAAARDTECGAEEGISTSGERGEGAKPVPRGAEEGISTSGESGRENMPQPQQVETNSEAEASSQEKAEELPTEERMASEAQEIVVSSEATLEPRVEEMPGAADSSDQVSARQQPCEAIEETAEAASVSATEEAVTAKTAPAEAQASSDGAAETASEGSDAEAVAAAPGEEAISAAVSEENAPTVHSGEAQTVAAASESAAASEESANEAVECSAAAEEKNDSPDQSL